MAEVSSRQEADAWLRTRARGTVWAHLGTREVADFAPSVKSMIEQTQREYSGRFLFELIQNAYDREPRHGDVGRVIIVLDQDEGDHGTDCNRQRDALAQRGPSGGRFRRHPQAT